MGQPATYQIRKPRALVVEDDPFVLIDMEDMLASIGLDIAGRAVSKSSALDLLKTEDFDFATIDYDLAGETSEEIAIELKKRNIPFILVSGKTSFVKDAPEFRDFPAVEKPVSEHVLAELVSELIA